MKKVTIGGKAAIDSTHLRAYSRSYNSHQNYRFAIEKTKNPPRHQSRGEIDTLTSDSLCLSEAGSNTCVAGLKRFTGVRIRTVVGSGYVVRQPRADATACFAPLGLHLTMERPATFIPIEIIA